MDGYLWITEAASELKVSTKTVRKWFDSGESVHGVTLEGFRLPGSGYRRLTAESVERLRDALHNPRPTD